MQAMESQRGLRDAYRKYGEIHGSIFFFSQEEPSIFLDYMERKAKHWPEYLEGFLSTISGEKQLKHRFLKVSLVDELKAEIKQLEAQKEGYGK